MNKPGVQQFIERWKASGASERANYQLFLSEICDVLGVPRPEPTQAEDEHNHYVFEKSVTFKHGDGTTTNGRIDLYKRGCFVLEAKQGVSPTHVHMVLPTPKKRARRSGHGRRGSAQWDHSLVAARAQADRYARALPASEGWPPFLVVVDVGHCIELYADFSTQGKAYLQYPNAQGFRIHLDALTSEKTQTMLRTVWTDPMSLDPSRHAAKVTRDIAEHMAILARSLEAAGYTPTAVAGFLMRCLFTMFAEDVNLIPADSFTQILTKLRGNAGHAAVTLRMLWESMDQGGFSPLLMAKVLRFNGSLFADPEALSLTEEQLELLIEAGETDWQDVEPAIFGPLLERALDPKERHKLGAHYTPRAYVERLVIPTVVEPLREDWQNVKIGAVALAGQGKLEEACEEVEVFHRRLCETRVLDPACGSGNFLYVTMEHMKRLEGEVLDTLRELGQGVSLFQAAEVKGFSVTPDQFLGIEANPMAAAVARVVLWIGYLQWHFRTRGRTMPPEPVLKTSDNIECRDAVLAWDGDPEPVTDEEGNPVTRWDGESTRPHPVTGELVPDETQRVPEERYLNPRRAEWPGADYVVGNPPFLGNKRMRLGLGGGYVEALRSTWNGVPRSADYVMYWWHKAAETTRSGETRRFGLITTNSLTQSFNRKVVENHIDAASGLSLVFAIPDHPWVDSSDGAAVRISMTVGERGRCPGVLSVVHPETNGDGEAGAEVFLTRTGRIHPDLAVGVDFVSAVAQEANRGLAFTGMYPLGQGFVLLPDDVETAIGTDANAHEVVKPFIIARDLTQRPRDAFVIDMYPRSVDRVQEEFPCLFQWLLERVKPGRDQNPRKSRRDKWWLFGETVAELRKALVGLERYIAVPRTAKWFNFVFVPSNTIPDTAVVAIATDDAAVLGVLSSRVHNLWAIRTGGRLGVGNDPRYQHKRTFYPFPFPVCSEEQQIRIRQLGEALDEHRKRRQALHPKLTLTNTYNVLAKLRTGEALTAKEKVTHEQGLCSVLKQIHEDLDAAVFEAFGWPVNLSDEDILESLMALNKERAEEEKRGVVRWLRPDFQDPTGKQATSETAELIPVTAADDKGRAACSTKVIATPKQPWPDSVSGQVQAVRILLGEAGSIVTVEILARRFRGRKAKPIQDILETLVMLGQAQRMEGGYGV